MTAPFKVELPNFINDSLILTAREFERKVKLRNKTLKLTYPAGVK